MTNYGSIGKLAEDVLSKVKSDKLTKLAQHKLVREISAHPAAKTKVGQALKKLAAILRSKSDDVTVAEVEGFLKEVEDAVRTS